MRIKNAQRLTDHGNVPMRKDIVAILEAGMTAADPHDNTLKLVRVENGKLLVGGKDFEPVGTPRPGVVELDLDGIDRIFVFGAGKGIQGAVEALEQVLGDRLTAGHIILKYGDDARLNRVGVTYAGHPVPDENCVVGCRKIVEMIEKNRLTPADVVFTVIGNGVSSLLTYPAEGLSIDGVKEVTRILQIEKGAYTQELNRIRTAVDRLKGGRITRLIHPARMFHILTVDCNKGNTDFYEGYRGLTEGNMWLHTLPDYTNATMAIDTLRHYEVWDEIAEEVRNHLLNAKPENGPLTKEEFERMDCRIYGVVPEHLGMLPAATAMAEKLGYTPHIVNKGHYLEASEAGKFMSNMAILVEEEDIPFKSPCALFMTGEKVVTVGKSKCVGGRNQEFCLTAAHFIAGRKRIAMGSVDTDGNDGPGGDFHPEATKAGVRVLAGGVVDGETGDAAKKLGFDLVKLQQAHDTSRPLWELGDAVWARHSISVVDLTVVLVGRKD